MVGGKAECFVALLAAGDGLEDHVRRSPPLHRLDLGGDVETGQGSELSSDAHYGADQVTMEARCYAYARVFHPSSLVGTPRM